MLTMICATILPEAFEKGGAVVGLAALGVGAILFYGSYVGLGSSL